MDGSSSTACVLAIIANTHALLLLFVSSCSDLLDKHEYDVAGVHVCKNSTEASSGNFTHILKSSPNCEWNITVSSESLVLLTFIYLGTSSDSSYYDIQVSVNCFVCAICFRNFWDILIYNFTHKQLVFWFLFHASNNVGTDFAIAKYCSRVRVLSDTANASKLIQIRVWLHHQRCSFGSCNI